QRPYRRAAVHALRVPPNAATVRAHRSRDLSAGSHPPQATGGRAVIRAQAEQILTAVTPAPSTPPESQSRPLNPTQLGKPAFLLAVPFSLSTEVANNPRMEDLPADRRGPDARKA